MPSKLARRAALLLLGLLAAGSAACGRVQAKAVPEVPALDMPTPPPRIVEASDPNVPPPVPLPTEPERNPPPRVRTPAPAAKAAEQAKPAEPPKPEQPVAESARPPEETPKPPQATTLQTAPAQREGEIDGRIRAALEKASSDLGRVNYRNLNQDARMQYDTAKGFIRQAEEARRARNLDFARNLADKAAALAAQLAGR